MKKRRILYFITVALILFVLFVLSKVLYPPPPFSRQLIEILPDSPALYLHCSELQARLKNFTQHEQYKRLLKTPYFHRMLQSKEGQAQLASFLEFLEDRLLSPMQFVGKELAFALYRNSGDSKPHPAVILLSRVSEKAKLAERVFYAFDWLTEIGVEKLSLKLQSHTVYQVQHQDLLFPLYYTLVSDVAMVSSSLELLETAMTRISQEETEQDQKAELFSELSHIQPESRFVTAFADPPALADEVSSNLFFSSFYRMNTESVEAIRKIPPVFSAFDIFPESIRLHAEFPGPPKERSDSQRATAANSCWENTEQIRQFPLLLDISPKALSALLRKLQEIFPQQQAWQNPFPEYTLWGNMIECRLSSKPVGKVYALPDLLCASDSPQPLEESVAAIGSLLNMILEQRVPPMLRSTMLRQERKTYQEIPVNTLQVMFQDVFSYTAFTNAAGETFNMTASNSATVKQGIDKIRTEVDAQPSYCTNVMPSQSKNGAEKGEILPAAAMWLHADRLARFLEDFSQTKSFELLMPRQKNAELYARLPELLRILRSLPPSYLELGMQENAPVARLWSQGYHRDK